MPRPAVEDWNPRRVTRGTVIRSKGGGPDEVVRGVSIVIHLANGVDEVYEEDEQIKVLKEQPPPVSEEDLPPEG